MEEALTATPLTPISLELTPEESSQLYSGNESLTPITTNTKALDNGTTNSLTQPKGKDTSKFLVDGFTRSSLFSNMVSGNGL